MRRPTFEHARSFGQLTPDFLCKTCMVAGSSRPQFQGITPHTPRMPYLMDEKLSVAAGIVRFKRASWGPCGKMLCTFEYQIFPHACWDFSVRVPTADSCARILLSWAVLWKASGDVVVNGLKLSFVHLMNGSDYCGPGHMSCNWVPRQCTRGHLRDVAEVTSLLLSLFAMYT
jgi:hypothetical protein